MSNTPAYSKEFIVNKLQTNTTWLLRGVLAIYKHQTNAEQCAGMTRESNNVGFNAVDSVILSSFAKQIKKWEADAALQSRFRTPLSPRQIEIARTKMKKYAGQLAAIANASASIIANASAVSIPARIDDGDEEATYNAAHGA